MTQSTIIIAEHQIDDVIAVLKIMRKLQLKGGVSMVVVTQPQAQPSHLSICNSLSDDKYLSFDVSAAGGHTKLRT